MNLDFTITRYKQLLFELKNQGYEFQTFSEYLREPKARFIILRHDVEAKYKNALIMAMIQYESRVKGTYYFRILENHFDEKIIREIASMGHEVGYHYDDLSACKGDYIKALKRFEINLQRIKEISEVQTICMEGAPLSKFDNRDLWAVYGRANHIHYHDYGLIGEPYFDLDFSKVHYLTDTGRRWDGKGSVRDKVQSAKLKVQSGVDSDKVRSGSFPGTIGTPGTPGTIGTIGTIGTRNQKPETRNQKPPFRRTNDIIDAASAGLLPDRIMLTFHPQRWTDRPGPWLQELVWQNVKNAVKRLVLRFKG